MYGVYLQQTIKHTFQTQQTQQPGIESSVNRQLASSIGTGDRSPWPGWQLTAHRLKHYMKSQSTQYREEKLKPKISL